jgi:hypothetical protein
MQRQRPARFPTSAERPARLWKTLADSTFGDQGADA